VLHTRDAFDARALRVEFKQVKNSNKYRRSGGGVAAVRPIAFAAAAVAALTAHGQTNLVLNGGFETTTPSGTSSQINQSGSTINGVAPFTVPDWNSANTSGGSPGYNFIYANPLASAPDVSSTGDTVTFWNASNGGTTNPTRSPNGGNFYASDPVYNTSAISQAITGLGTKATNYTLTFYYAAAQQTTQTGATTEWWQVTLGGKTNETSVISLPSKGFSGWQTATLQFNNITPSSGSLTLSFLAEGTPTGLPPFCLLDGVSLIQVPETSASPFVWAGMAAFGVYAAQRRMRRTA
jgi:hypothetical protein